jgi:quinol monooxygenase YgiN
MTIVVIAEIDVDPKKRDAALADAKQLIDLALSEQGCLHYNWSSDPFVPGRINVFEQWDSAEELQRHFSAPSYTGMLSHLDAHGLISANARKYKCDLIEPVYGPDGVATATFLSATE